MSLGKIRILIYSDDERFSEKGDSLGRGGMSMLTKLVDFKMKSLAKVDIKLLNRHVDETGKELHAINKLSDDLLKDFDELWVFGYKRVNTASEPENSLTAPEIGILKTWMDSGLGVMVTGDHSEQTFVSSLNSNLSLGVGRALGQPIPRAGELRIWEKGPNLDDNNFNTIEGVFPPTSLNESDSIPQHLTLVGAPNPHELFWWRIDDNGEQLLITKFPDHMHEGVAIVPRKLNRSNWPKNITDVDKPKTVAIGRDKRFIDKCHALVVVYDGDKHGFGRIVADSSFHHYVNENLKGFPNDRGMPIEKSDLDQIAQYYANLALWLAPKKVRDKMKQNIIFQLAKNESVFSLRGEKDHVVGKLAHLVLGQLFGHSELRRLFGPAKCAPANLAPNDPDRFNNILFLIIFGGDHSSDSISFGESDKYEMLGCLLKSYFQELETMGISNPALEEDDPISREIFERLLLDCFKKQSSSLTERANKIQALFN